MNCGLKRSCRSPGSSSAKGRGAAHAATKTKPYRRLSSAAALYAYSRSWRSWQHHAGHRGHADVPAHPRPSRVLAAWRPCVTAPMFAGVRRLPARTCQSSSGHSARDDVGPIRSLLHRLLIRPHPRRRGWRHEGARILQDTIRTHPGHRTQPATRSQPKWPRWEGSGQEAGAQPVSPLFASENRPAPTPQPLDVKPGPIHVSAELIVAKQYQRHASMRAAWRYGVGCFFGHVRLAPSLAACPLSPDAELTRRQTTSDHAAPRCFAMHARRLILAHHGMPDTCNAPCLLLLTPTRGSFAVTRCTQRTVSCWRIGVCPRAVLCLRCALCFVPLTSSPLLRCVLKRAADMKQRARRRQS